MIVNNGNDDLLFAYGSKDNFIGELCRVEDTGFIEDSLKTIGDDVLVFINPTEVCAL